MTLYYTVMRGQRDDDQHTKNFNFGHANAQGREPDDPRERATKSESEWKGLQNCGQTSSVVWCRDLGNNDMTRSTTISKLGEDAEMDVRSDTEG